MPQGQDIYHHSTNKMGKRLSNMRKGYIHTNHQVLTYPQGFEAIRFQAQQLRFEGVVRLLHIVNRNWLSQEPNL